MESAGPELKCGLRLLLAVIPWASPLTPISSRGKDYKLLEGKEYRFLPLCIPLRAAWVVENECLSSEAEIRLGRSLRLLVICVPL